MTSSFRRLLRIPLLLALSPVASATTWYVNGVSGRDSNNCMSATTACKTIGHAISLAHSGDLIRVAAATYKEHILIPVRLGIVGSGTSTTAIDGKGSTFGERLVVIAMGASVTLSQLAIRNSAGGGIYNAGTLIISNTTLNGNHIGLVCRTGGCKFTGGGIYNAGTLIISNTTLSGNSAGGACSKGCESEGGGIYNSSKLTISNSTLSGNSSLNCIVPIGCFPSGPGGGIFNDRGTVTLQNNIVANNTGENCSGTMTSYGYNLSTDPSCNFNNTGDLLADPKLGTLGYYGGPTQTIPLLSGSPAIDAGNPSGCTDGLGHLLKTDQRAMPRPDKEDKTGCDMGAYERQSD